MIGRVLTNIHTHGRAPAASLKLGPVLPPILGPTDVKSTVPYRLEVTLVLEKQHVRGLTQPGMAEGLNQMHAPAGLTMVHSMWNFDDAPSETSPVTIRNVWSMFNADSMLRAEILLPDEPTYAQFQQFVLSEEKNLLLPILPKTHDAPPPEKFNYFVVSRPLKLRRVAEFAARLEAGSIPFGEKHEWRDGQAYFSLTGRTGSVTQYWKIPTGLSLKDARAAIDRASWSEPDFFVASVKSESMIVAPTLGDPNFDKGVKYHAA